ncbi:hypothetical protein SK128_025289 [Halocaridina rubra]|uniref:BTB domain-containing protein n=1 Tax=Halocaridina rubra TaxID=373956 RepID=A0AAN8WJB0_HALRR
MADKQVKLRWNGYASVFSDSLHRYFNQPKFADAMIACDGRIFMVHRIVLSMCSDYFSEMFELLPNDNTRPVIVLNEASANNVAAVLSYMYRGEVIVPNATLPSVFSLMKYLKIKGLLNFQEYDGQTEKKKLQDNSVNKEETCKQHNGGKQKVQNSKGKHKSSLLKRKSSLLESSSKKLKNKNPFVEKQALVYSSSTNLTLMSTTVTTTTTTSTTTSPTVVTTGSIAVLNTLPSGPVVTIPINSLPPELHRSVGTSLKPTPILATHLTERETHSSIPVYAKNTPPVAAKSTAESSFKLLPESPENDQHLLIDIKEEVKEEPLTLGPDDPITEEDDEDYCNGDDDSNSLPDVSTEYIKPVSPSVVGLNTLAESHTFTVSPSLTDPHGLTISSSTTQSPHENLSSSTASNLVMPMMTVRIPVPPISPPVDVSVEPSTAPGGPQIASFPMRSTHVLPQILSKPAYGTTGYITAKDSTKKAKPSEESHPTSEHSNLTVRVKSFASIINSKQVVPEVEKSFEPPVVEIPETEDEVDLPSVMYQTGQSGQLEVENGHTSEEFGIRAMMKLINEGMEDQSVNFISVCSEKIRNPPYLIRGNRITSKNAEPVKFRLTGSKPNQVISVCMRYSEEKFKNYPVVVCRLHQTVKENCNFRVSTSETCLVDYDVEMGHPTAYINLRECDVPLGTFEFFVTFICLNSCHKDYGKKMELVLKLMDSAKGTVLRETHHEVRVCKNVKRDYRESLQGEVLVRPDTLLYADGPDTTTISASDVKGQLVNLNRSQSLEKSTSTDDTAPAPSSLPGPVSEGQSEEFYFIRLPNSKKGKMLLNLVKEFDRNIPDLESMAPSQSAEDSSTDS